MDALGEEARLGISKVMKSLTCGSCSRKVITTNIDLNGDV